MRWHFGASIPLRERIELLEFLRKDLLIRKAHPKNDDYFQSIKARVRITTIQCELKASLAKNEFCNYSFAVSYSIYFL